jgi:hypothetical protein
VAFVSVGVLLSPALTVVTMLGVLNSAFGDPELPRAVRDEIVHANCQELSSLEATYEFGADSVAEDVVALRLTRKRQAQLHFAIRTDALPPSNEVAQQAR